jgi:TnpA family transposase
MWPIRGSAPRIRDLADKPGKPGQWPALSPLIGGSLNLKLVEQQFLELVRLAASIKQGTVTASLILRKLGSYPRQNSLALALRELGRIERTLFTLHWLQDPALRRRVQVGLNKGEARNALARAVFFYRLGEIRDRSPRLMSIRTRARHGRDRYCQRVSFASRTPWRSSGVASFRFLYAGRKFAGSTRA